MGDFFICSTSIFDHSTLSYGVASTHEHYGTVVYPCVSKLSLSKGREWKFTKYLESIPVDAVLGRNVRPWKFDSSTVPA